MSKTTNPPTLTDFYQIKLPTGWQQESQYLLGSELDIWDKENTKKKGLTDDERIKRLASFAILQMHTYIAMNAVADDLAIPDPTFLYLSGKVKHYLAPTLKGELAQDGGVINIKWTSGNPMIARVYRDILSELMDVMARKVSVSRCASCGAVFVERRGIQRWCSARCSNRERVRRQREKAAQKEAAHA